MRRSLVFVAAALVLTSGAVQAQLVDDYNPPRSNCCLANSARTLADQLRDLVDDQVRVFLRRIP